MENARIHPIMEETGSFSLKHPCKPYINRLIVMREDRIQWHQQKINAANDSFQDRESRGIIYSSFKPSPIQTTLTSMNRTPILTTLEEPIKRRRGIKGSRNPRLMPVTGVSLIESSILPSQRTERSLDLPIQSPAMSETNLLASLKGNSRLDCNENSPNKTLKSKLSPSKNNRLKPLLLNSPYNSSDFVRSETHISVESFSSPNKTRNLYFDHISHTNTSPHNQKARNSKSFDKSRENGFIKIAAGLTGNKSQLTRKIPASQRMLAENSSHSLFARVGPNTPVCDSENDFFE